MYRLLLSLAVLISMITPTPAQESPAPAQESPVTGQEKKRFALYATLTENVQVQMSDGSKWNMDKGDTFPVMMYKEQQTKVVLQLASSNFMVKTEQAKVFEEKELTEAQWQTYRNNVTNYLESQARKWKERAK